MLNSNLFNSDLHHGRGLTFEANYRRHLWGGGFTRLTFEVPAVFDLDEDLNFAGNSVPASYKAFFVTPPLRANVFATTAISPWVSLGGGVGRFSPSSNLEFGGPSNAKSSTTGVMQIGLGLDVRIKPRWSFMAECGTSGRELRTPWSTPERAASTTTLSAAA